MDKKNIFFHTIFLHFYHLKLIGFELQVFQHKGPGSGSTPSFNAGSSDDSKISSAAKDFDQFQQPSHTRFYHL
jgi:hypothetical protein